MAPTDLSTQSSAKRAFLCCQTFSGVSSHAFSSQFLFIFTWTVRTSMGSAFAHKHLYSKVDFGPNTLEFL